MVRKRTSLRGKEVREVVQRVFVVDTNHQPLMPCHPARAKELLRKGKAAILRYQPFTIILNYAVESNNQPLALKIDPGSRESGLVLVATFKDGQEVIWANELEHRGQAIREALLTRRHIRRGRRNRNTRYRAVRFANRRRCKGWLPPSLQSRVQNILTWVSKLSRFTPSSSLSIELAKFDTQLMQNAELAGVEYQQGKLQGYEVKQYLLEKWGHQCAYCGAKDVPLETEHILPTSRGGSNRVDNLTLACHACNQRKGNQTAAEFGYPDIQAQATQPLKDAAAVNVTRWVLYEQLQDTGLPVEIGTGGHTNFNRTSQTYPKAHWIDAACVGQSGAAVSLNPEMQILCVKAVGRESRQMCRMDKYGFPRTRAKQQRHVYGFQTGDLVAACVPAGKYRGVHVGRVAVRAKGTFRVGKTDGLSWKHCRRLQAADGYEYQLSEGKSGAILPYV